MKVKQISVFLENKSGRLEEVTKILAENGVDIRALSLADTRDYGILRLIVNDYAKAYSLLKDSNFTVQETDVVAAEVPDKPGGLAGILRVLNSMKISVEYMYAFVERKGDKAIMIFRFENVDQAIEALKGSDVRLLKGEEVYKL
jgi:hypothetical protein